MKRIFIALPALLLALAGFVSCAEDLNNTGTTPVAEQQPMKHGVLKSVNTTDGYDYYTVCTTNAAGEDFVYAVRQGQAGGRFEGENRVLFSSEGVDNHDSLKVVASGAGYSYFGDGREEEPIASNMYVVQLRDGSYITQLISDNGVEFSSKAEFSETYPPLAGYYEGYNADSTKMFYGLFDDPTSPVAIMGSNDAVQSLTVVYDQATGKGTLTGDAGTVAELFYNEGGQLVAVIEGDSLVLDPDVSDSEPESFNEAYTATFTSSLFGYTDPDVLIYEGDKGIGNYAFGPYIDADAFFFNLAEDNTISFDPQDTGYSHVQNGQTYGEVYAYDANAQGQSSDPSFYDPAAQTFHFFCFYYIPAAGGGFGTFEETLKITGYADGATRAKVRLKNHKEKKTRAPRSILETAGFSQFKF